MNMEIEMVPLTGAAAFEAARGSRQTVGHHRNE